jgi:uncharacterized membrane protein
MLVKITLIALIFLFPAIILFLEQKSKIINWLSPIVICYLTGIIAANLPFLEIDSELMKSISEISIGLAIPLLLFNSNIPDWLKHAGKSLLSYTLSILAVIISSTLAHYFFKSMIPESWRISGMLIGVYTGGTPNMSAIGVALDTPDEIFVLINSSDVILGALYFVFLITLSRRLFGTFLPPYDHDQREMVEQVEEKKLSVKKMAANVIVVLLLGVLIFGIAAYTTLFIKGELAGPWVILIMTTLGIGVSFIKKIQRMKGSYETAHYLLLVFSLAIGAMADISQLIEQSSYLFAYTAFVMFLSIFIHFGLAALFRIDRDTAIITNTAAIYGPAFIGPIANAIQNKKVIVAGITMGLLGYAIGNYLGIGIAMLLSP